MEALDVDMTARVGKHEGDMQCPACPSTWRTTVKGHEIESFQQPKGPKFGAYVVRPLSLVTFARQDDPRATTGGDGFAGAWHLPGLPGRLWGSRKARPNPPAAPDRTCRTTYHRPPERGPDRGGPPPPSRHRLFRRASVLERPAGRVGHVAGPCCSGPATTSCTTRCGSAYWPPRPASPGSPPPARPAPRIGQPTRSRTPLNGYVQRRFRRYFEDSA